MLFLLLGSGAPSQYLLGKEHLTAGGCLWFLSGPSVDGAVGPLVVPSAPEGSIQTAKRREPRTDSSVCGNSLVFFHTGVFPYA